MAETVITKIFNLQLTELEFLILRNLLRGLSENVVVNQTNLNRNDFHTIKDIQEVMEDLD